MKTNRTVQVIIQKVTAILMFLMLLSAVCPITKGTAEGANPEFTAYLPASFTMQQLFDTAEEALKKGMPAGQIKQEMAANAESRDALDWLNCAIENISAADSQETEGINALLGAYGDQKRIRLEYEYDHEYNRDLKYRIYDVLTVSDELKAVLHQDSAHSCLEPSFWTESDFSMYFGKPFSKFKPEASRPGYVCIVVRDSSESAPGTAWNDGDMADFRKALENTLTDFRSILDEDTPALTGNPQLASTFWIFELKYPFHGLYGTEGEVKGYNCSLSLTVENAKDHKKIAEFEFTEILPNRISSWSNGIAKARVPSLYVLDGYREKFEKFAEQTRIAVKKERSATASARKITTLNAKNAVNALLLQQTEKLNDPWQKAIYESGAENISLEGNRLSFTLRGYDPKLKELGAYANAENPTEWLMTALRNASAYELEISLELEDGTVSAKGLKTLKTAVQKAAAAAKKDFGGKEMTAAIKDYLFPTPIAGKLKDPSELASPTERFTTWYTDHARLLNYAPVEVASAAFYMQKSQTVSVKDGPHAITLTCTGASLSSFVNENIREVLDAQAYFPAAQRSAVANPDEELKTTILKNAAEAAKKAKDKTVLTLDLDELATGNLPPAYGDYFAAFNWENAVSTLTATLNQLPESAAQPLPKAGLLSGENRGTKVIFKVSGNANPTYIVMRNAYTDTIAVTAMIREKKSVTVHVPQGQYEIAWCSGPYWYGTQELFSTLGSYQKSEQVQIMDSRYYHTFVLESSQDGDVSIYGASPEDFR